MFILLAPQPISIQYIRGWFYLGLLLRLIKCNNFRLVLFNFNFIWDFFNLRPLIRLLLVYNNFINLNWGILIINWNLLLPGLLGFLLLSNLNRSWFNFIKSCWRRLIINILVINILDDIDWSLAKASLWLIIFIYLESIESF